MGAGALLACSCVCLALVGGGGVLAYRLGIPLVTEIGPALTQLAPALTEAGYTPTPSPAPGVIHTAVPTPLPGSLDTYTAVENDRVPSSDLRALATRLKGIPNIPEAVSTAPANYHLGETVKFWVSNEDTNSNSQVNARLAYETQNVYFFVEDGVRAQRPDIQKLVDDFQNNAYPTDRQYFGSEWIPGVDGDPHVYILYARGLGANVGGYYDSSSEYSHLVNPYSNEKEIFFLNADSGTPLSDAYWGGTLAHEFQHMIRWYHHPDDTAWLNEGFSMLAEQLNGYEPGNEPAFLANPDLQLNAWSDLSASPQETAAHYGGAYLFLQYLLDRFGENGIRALSSDRTTDLAAVDDALAALGTTDPATGKPLTAVDVFADWIVANFLNDPSVGSGRYAYKNFTSKIYQPTSTVSTCPQAPTATTVHQYATDYIAIQCQGPVTVDFAGSEQAQLVPTLPHAGRYAFWSNRRDGSDATLTREYDLTHVTSATLDYWAWWELEKDFDYTYVEVSADGGQTWNMLHSPSGTSANPNGGNLGWVYTGCSGGGDPAKGCAAQWVEEKVDLSPYAGKKIEVRFETVNDQSLNYPGFEVDDMRVPELNDSCRLDSGSCGWTAEGFVRVDDVLPQTFVVQVIHQSGGQTTVERMPLDATNQGSLAVDLKRGDRTILVVAGTAPFTTELASYQYGIK